MKISPTIWSRRRLLAAGSLLAISGCRPQAAPPGSSSGFPLTIVDDLRRRVTLAAPPRRIISLAPAHTETLFAIGAGERVVAVDNYSNYPPEAARLHQINCWPEPPLERIAALEPDLVLVLTQDASFLNKLERLGLPGAQLFPKSLSEALDSIQKVGVMVDRKTQAESLAERIEAGIADVRGKVGKRTAPSFMLELDASDPAQPYVAGGRGLYSDLLEAAGGRNIFDDSQEPALRVSSEQVVARDPEVILLGDASAPVQPQKSDDVARRPGWSGIAAVRHKRVFTVNDELLTRPGPRMAEGVRQAAMLFHPDLDW